MTSCFTSYFWQLLGNNCTFREVPPPQRNTILVRPRIFSLDKYISQSKYYSSKTDQRENSEMNSTSLWQKSQVVRAWFYLVTPEESTPGQFQRLAKKQLIRNKWFSFTVSVSKNEPRIKAFEKFFRINKTAFSSKLIRTKESRNSFFDSLVWIRESRSRNLELLIRTNQSRNNFF